MSPESPVVGTGPNWTTQDGPSDRQGSLRWSTGKPPASVLCCGVLTGRDSGTEEGAVCPMQSHWPCTEPVETPAGAGATAQEGALWACAAGKAAWWESRAGWTEGAGGLEAQSVLMTGGDRCYSGRFVAFSMRAPKGTRETRGWMSALFKAGADRQGRPPTPHRRPAGGHRTDFRKAESHPAEFFGRSGHVLQAPPSLGRTRSCLFYFRFKPVPGLTASVW